jgi:hypothetical protein
MGTQGVDYDFITDPSGCILETFPNMNYPNWMIAVYWMELHAVASPASINFRETTDATVLNQAKSDVEKLSSVSSFTPQWAYVITWYTVSYNQGWQYKQAPVSYSP